MTDTPSRLRAEAFFGRAGSGADLARRLGVPQQAVASELSRLDTTGFIAMCKIGTAASRGSADKRIRQASGTGVG